MKNWTNRSQAKLLMTNQEQTNLLVVPRMHLQQILSGELELEHLYSVAGVFNIAAALANYRHLRELELVFDRAQATVAILIQEFRKPTADEGPVITAAFNAADRLIRKQKKPDLARAIAYVDRRIALGDVVKPNDPLKAEQ